MGPFHNFSIHHDVYKCQSGMIKHMGKGLVSLMLAIGASTWLFNHFQQTSGNNTVRSLKAAAIAGLVIFAFSFVIFGLIL